MTQVQARAYLSPTLVLLALNWDEAEGDDQFLGFAIQRAPGFRDPQTGSVSPQSWLPNRIGFNGPPPPGKPDFPSNAAPIQKFMWWDARIDEQDRGAQFTYEIWPVRGTPAQFARVDAAKTKLVVTLPPHLEHGVGTYFNRAVVSSQAFSRKLKAMGLDPKKAPPAKKALELRTWLSNDLENVIPEFLRTAPETAGAIYHLTDDLWIIPALTAFAGNKKKATLVYDAKTTKNKDGSVRPSPNAPVVKALGKKVKFKPRKRANIMHDKFLVAGKDLLKPQPEATHLVCGSANYTTQGLTSQANLMHSFDSPALGRLYLERINVIQTDPTLGTTAKANTGWSDTVTVGDAGVRVYFSPEAADKKEQIETIVREIHRARSSVLFCLFTPTDADLRNACFAAGDNGLMMFGLVNHISEPKDSSASAASLRADELAQIELYHRSRDKRDVIDAAYFHPKTVPAGFEPELRIFPGEKLPPYPPVIIHHKFVVIDAEGISPIIYTGSANMSANSVNRNDENLLEIRGSRRLAGIYLAEFMRLYEHYRARAHSIQRQQGTAPPDAFQLTKDSRWAKKFFVPGSPESRSRINMARP